MARQALRRETLSQRSEEKLCLVRSAFSFSFTCPNLYESKMWFEKFRMPCENTQLLPSFRNERQLEKHHSNSSGRGSASLNELQLARH